MAMTFQAPMTQNLRVATNNWYTLDGTIQKTLNIAGAAYTAGANGAIIKSLFATNNSATTTTVAFALIEPSGIPILSTAATAATTTAVTGLTFALGDATQLAVGMTVTGTNVPSSTTIAAIVSYNAITLSQATTGAIGSVLTFGRSSQVVSTAATAATTTAVTGLAFAQGDATQLAVGMFVSGTNVVSGTYVAALVSSTAVTLSQATVGAAGAVLTFTRGQPIVTTSSAPTGTSTTAITALAFSAGDATQLSIGMGVSGTNVALGTYVSAIGSTTALTLSKATTGAPGILTFTQFPVLNQVSVVTKAGGDTAGVIVPADLLNPTSSAHTPIDQMGKTILYMPPGCKLLVENLTTIAANSGSLSVTAMIEEF